jgi:hypothetical protein
MSSNRIGAAAIFVSLLLAGACRHPRLDPPRTPRSEIASASGRIQDLRLALFDGGHPDWDLILIEAQGETLVLHSPEYRPVDLDLALRIAGEREDLGPVISGEQ